MPFLLSIFSFITNALKVVIDFITMALKDPIGRKIIIVLVSLLALYFIFMQPLRTELNNTKKQLAATNSYIQKLKESTTTTTVVTDHPSSGAGIPDRIDSRSPRSELAHISNPVPLPAPDLPKLATWKYAEKNIPLGKVWSEDKKDSLSLGYVISGFFSKQIEEFGTPKFEWKAFPNVIEKKVVTILPPPPIPFLQKKEVWLIGGVAITVGVVILIQKLKG